MERRRRARQGFSGKGDVRLIAQWKAGPDKRTFFFNIWNRQTGVVCVDILLSGPEAVECLSLVEADPLGTSSTAKQWWGERKTV